MDHGTPPSPDLCDCGWPANSFACRIRHNLHDCGWPVDSFACRIRHQHLNTGAAKAAHD